MDDGFWSQIIFSDNYTPWITKSCICYTVIVLWFWVVRRFLDRVVCHRLAEIEPLATGTDVTACYFRTRKFDMLPWIRSVIYWIGWWVIFMAEGSRASFIVNAILFLIDTIDIFACNFIFFSLDWKKNRCLQILNYTIFSKIVTLKNVFTIIKNI